MNEGRNNEMNLGEILYSQQSCLEEQRDLSIVRSMTHEQP